MAVCSSESQETKPTVTESSGLDACLVEKPIHVMLNINKEPKRKMNLYGHVTKIKSPIDESVSFSTKKSIHNIENGFENGE